MSWSHGASLIVISDYSKDTSCATIIDTYMQPLSTLSSLCTGCAATKKLKVQLGRELRKQFEDRCENKCLNPCSTSMSSRPQGSGCRPTTKFSRASGMLSPPLQIRTCQHTDQTEICRCQHAAPKRGSIGGIWLRKQ